MKAITDAPAEEGLRTTVDPGTPSPATAPRLASLDQFRGYTVAGMFVVNFLGGYAATPGVLRHHNCYCSFADTIMPQFLFAVGFAFRLTFGLRVRALGLQAAYLRVIRRLGLLVLLSLVLYSLDGEMLTCSKFTELGFWSALAEPAKRQWFQTLMHIAVTTLWVLPVIRAGVAVRVAYLIFSAALHIGLSGWFNFRWVNTPPQGIDGGPLGFLTWAIPALVGTLACDALANSSPGRRYGQMLAWPLGLMALGYGLSCGTRLYDVPVAERTPPPAKFAESPVVFYADRIRGRDLASFLAEPPFVPPPDPSARQWNYWMMSQRSGTVSYQLFGAGFSLAVFLLFSLGCDWLGWRLGLFGTLGINALAAYILGGLVELAVKPFIPREAPGWQVLVGLAFFFACSYLPARLLETKGIRLRL